MPAEYPRKIYMVRIAAQSADLSHRSTGKAQKIFSLLYAQGCQELPGGLSGFFQKAPMKTGTAQSGSIDQLINGYCFAKVLSDEAHRLPNDSGIPCYLLVFCFPEQFRKKKIQTGTYFKSCQIAWWNFGFAGCFPIIQKSGPF